MNIKAGIIGGAGYTGGELIRLLIHHPFVTVAFIHSRSNAGKPVTDVHADLVGDTDLRFTDAISQDIDVLFLCLGHGESTKFLKETPIDASVRIIDLANDFRLRKDSNQSQLNRSFVYGLPELNREAIKNAQNIANPGCFATTIQLGLLPLAHTGILKDIYTTGITGSTGAGQKLAATSHFSWRANNIQAYKTLTHQHLGEIGESLDQLQPGTEIDLSFVPWRGDFTRGIFISSTITTDLSLEELYVLFENFYNGHPFTVVSRAPIFLKQIVNTNKAVIQLEKVGSKLVVHSAADNLLKGASGQAVQNMNLLFGIDERAGLNLKPAAF
ncbi:N-acetyl-gamma-glutamyl-phosphate reductase [Niabella sp. CC-SYL272]|uniref:N-acetyl-gamma-glutamyl-phosphate reductase n=1 Tax=Niabella agricola TaxID=2891571 RepID=UPI001F2A6F89|nr:N-acetyl-gamma-glutamyl-phosphate reductase [Niabella agricola]MCF3109326.1 N-acetyl-gamma-glutamyl-phosphate reductase [Niabella agricola]